MHLFFCPSLDGHMIDLPEDEARHAAGVLRLRAGERIGLLDGRGTRAEAEIATADKKSCTARVVQRSFVPRERTAGIHIACAPTKQIDRFEWMLEKCTEIGVDRITPLLTTRTERHTLRTDRLLKILVSAMKQSQRSWLPRLDEPTQMNALLEQELPAQRFFGWCEGQHQLFTIAYNGKKDAVVMIGPEGDFTVQESEQLRSHGFSAVSLGAARLRTETAAVVANTWMSLAHQPR